ncbi:hypothetical protein GCM10027082_47180 [Comamonas humi]
MNDSVKTLADEASTLAHRGMDAVCEGASQLRSKSQDMQDATTTYIQQDPLKSMLVAVGAGAVLVGLVALFSRLLHDKP